MRTTSVKLSTFNVREVAAWLADRRLAKYSGILRKTGAELVSTSRRSLINQCGVMDGIRLYNLIQHWHRKEIEIEQQKQKLHLIAYNAIMEKPSSKSELDTPRARVGSVVEEEDESDSEDSDLGENPEPNLTMGQVRRVLSSATGCPVDDVSRVLINKRLKNGSVIKIALTDEFLSKFTLDPSSDQNSFLSINQVY